MRTFFLFALTVVISLLLVGIAAADIPRLVNFQGYLVDDQDTPLTGEYGVTFRIYDNSTGGKVLWSETDTIVVEKGLYSITLGQKNPIDMAIEDDLWFALQIAGQSEMKPRYRLASVLYSIMAANAKRLDGYEVSGTPEAGKLIPLGPDGKLPASVLPDHTAVSTDLTQRGRSSGSATTKGFATGELLDGTTTDDVVDDALEGEWTLVGDVLYTSGDWGIARGGASNVLYGDGTHTMNNLGTDSRTGHEGYNRYYATVSGGFRNVAAHDYSTVAGGGDNKAKGRGATIGGGGLNTASGKGPVIGGGSSNVVKGDYSAILGGKGNTITETADYSYLFGIGSNLTQDSTFMVDMPHIRFGDEVDGYEFPATDGADGQVMATDGNGQLGWTYGQADSDWVISGDNMYSGVPGNVGIGTASPTEPLEVAGIIYSDSGGFKFPDGSIQTTAVTGGVADTAKFAWNADSLDGHNWGDLYPDADEVDGYHASNVPTPNYLYPLDGNTKIPNSRLYTGSGNGLDADMLEGYHAGNASGQVPVSNGNLNASLNADLLDGQDANSFVDLSSSQTISGSKVFNNFGSKYNGASVWLQNPPTSAIVAVDGISNGNGLYVINTSSNHPTIWARADGNTNTISARNNSAGPGFPTMWGQNDNSHGTNTIFALNNSSYSGPGSWPTIYGRNLSGACAIYADGDFCGSGGKYAVVTTSEGEALLSVIESPEVWFEDFGEGQLINGRTRIELDPLFLETVTINDQHPMKVFVQLNDDCRGVFVKRSKTGFDVTELQGGTSNAAFDYRVVAKRKGYENARLPLANIRHTDPYTSSGFGKQ